MQPDVMRRLDAALERVSSAYAKLLGKNGISTLSSIGIYERNGAPSYDVGHFDGVDIYVSIGKTKSSLHAASNCHYPSLSVMEEYPSYVDSLADALEKASVKD
jgi:hypothetical protein